MNKLSIETKLFVILFKLAQLVKFVLALIMGKLHRRASYQTILPREWIEGSVAKKNVQCCFIWEVECPILQNKASTWKH